MESLANDINRNVVVLVYVAEPALRPSCLLPNLMYVRGFSRIVHPTRGYSRSSHFNRLFQIRRTASYSNL